MKNVKTADINRSWHLFDAKKEVLGRLSTKIALILMGKNKSYYTPYLDTGDFVVVTNAQKVALSGKKEKQKKYYHHSQFPGGLKVKTAQQVREQKPEEVIRHSVRGMLPKTKIGKLMLKKLYFFKDDKHPYTKKFKNNRSAGYVFFNG